jgi:hypothetical protein
MFSLLRAAFWVCVALALLPSFVPREHSTVAADVAAGDAVNAASATVADLSRLCERRPDACEAGSDLAVAFGQRTREGAKILYDLIGTRVVRSERVDTQEEAGRPSNAGSTTDAAPPARNVVAPSQNTLTAADLMPPWRSPHPRRDPSNKHAT